MGTRIALVGLILTALLGIPSRGADPNADEGKPLTRKEFDELKNRVDETQATLVAMDKKYGGEFEDLRRRLKDNEADVGTIHKDFEELKTRLNDAEVGLGQISRVILENGQPRRIPDISGNMKQTEFKSDFTGAVHNVMKQTGTLRIYNKMSTSQTMRIVYADYTAEYLVPAGEYRDIAVGVGTVTTQLGGGSEGPKNWTVAPPTYFQEVDIVPRATPWVTVEPPVFIRDPILFPPSLVGPPAFYDVVRY